MIKEPYRYLCRRTLMRRSPLMLAGIVSARRARCSSRNAHPRTVRQRSGGQCYTERWFRRDRPEAAL